jgi:predicted PurR-regulated permease PerM
MNRRSAFFVGVTGAAGALFAVGAGYLVLLASDVLSLVLLAFFVAVGLQPAVTFLSRRGFRHSLAVTVVAVALVVVLVGFLAAAVVPLVDQADRLTQQLRDIEQTMRDTDTTLGRLNQQFRLEDLVGSAAGPSLVGRALVDAVTSTLLVLVLTIYFLADLRRIRDGLYRLVPARRRPRAILIGDQIYAKIGAFLFGNLLVSALTGTVVFASLMAFGVPYALFLAIMAAVLDLVPVVGTLLAGIVVTAVALTVSVPVCLGVLAVLTVYKVLEDYLLLPKIIGRAVSVPAVVTVVAVLLGGALAGVTGALVSIPMAAAVLLILREVSIPWLDRS